MPVVTPPTVPEDEARQSDRFAQSFSFEGVAAGDGQPQGQPQGDGQQGQAPTPPSLNLPQIDTDRYSAPEKPKDKRNALAIMQALGAAGALFGAAGDDNLMTRVGAGLSGAGRKGVQQVDEEFAAKQKAFQDFMRKSQRFNTEQQTKEAQANFDAQLARFENQLAEDRIRLEDELDQPTKAEQELTRAKAETERAQGEKYREQGDAALMRARRSGAGTTDEELPDSPDELRSLKRQIDAEIQAVRSQIPSETNMMGEPKQPVLSRQLSERVANLAGQRARVQEKLRQMEQGSQPGQGGGNPGGRGQGGSRTDEIPQDQLFENRDTVFNQGGTVAPGQRGTSSAGQSGRSGGAGNQGGQGQQFQLPQQVEDNILEMAPSDVPLDSLRRDAAMVMSDTTKFEPADFEQAYGFNPFR